MSTPTSGSPQVIWPSDSKKTLSGVPQLRPRWKRCVTLVDDQLGEALGQEFVARTFSPELKQKTSLMTRQIEHSMEEDINTLAWMSPATKQQALEKLHTIVNKIGYPDKWRDYSSVEIKPNDFVGNVLVWDKATVRAMAEAIQSATKKSWALALCRKRPFSEYLLYGRFVTSSPAHLAAHQIVERSLALAHWDESRLDSPSIEAMMHDASPEQVALCIQSYSGTSIGDIRGVLSAAREPEPA